MQAADSISYVDNRYAKCAEEPRLELERKSKCTKQNKQKQKQKQSQGHGAVGGMWRKNKS